MAYFAMMAKRWPCGDSLRALNDKPAVAVVWNTFGESTQCLKRYLDLPRDKILEIHVVNEVCSKNRRCGAYELLRNRTTSDVTKLLIKKDKRFLSRFKNELLEIKKLLDPYKDTKLSCYISPLLESPQNAKNVSPLFSLIREVIPYCQVVWSPLKTQGIGGADVYEGHSDRPKLPRNKSCIVNLDGTDITQVEVGKYIDRYRQCDAQFLWTYSFNLNHKHPPFIDPRKRTRLPTRGELKQIGSYLEETPRERPITEQEKLSARGCRSYRNPFDGKKKGFVLKQSETKKNAAQEYRAVFILPKGTLGREVSLVYKGKKLERLQYVYQLGDGSGRKVFQSNRAPQSLPYNTYLNSDNTCWILRNPKQRID